MAAVKKAKKRPTSSSKLTLRDLKLLTTLRRRGWKVSRVSRPRKLLPPAVSARYPRVPAGVLRLLSALEACCSPKETVWFLTAKDYARTGDAGFRWNEFEIMSLDSADGDPELEAEIRSFWDGHFPVMLAVHSDYDYLAVRLSDGAVVHGYAPEWESPGEVAASFAALLIALEAEADAERDDGPFHIFVGSAS